MSTTVPPASSVSAAAAETTASGSHLRRDVPVPSSTGQAPAGALWGSDAIALLLRELDLGYVCINPGASFRGLHDSIVNYLGNERPQMLLCLHEEHAVAIAHGYAKVTGRPMGVIVHSNVGLMHASMAIFNAWCDRVPVVILGATGPVDAAKRRPWIDWIHTARDQGALVRGFIKWDDQPGSVAASYEALLRANQIAQTSPKGPVYVCFDAALQEQKLDVLPPMPQVARYGPPAAAHAPVEIVERIAAVLRSAKRPLLLMGRVSRGVDAWNSRVALAEKLGARVLTDLKVGAAFPTDHPLHAAPPGVFLAPQSADVIRSSDVVVSLDWLDLAGTLKQAWGAEHVSSTIVQVSLDQYVHHGWSMDYQGLPATDIYVACEPEPVVTALLGRLANPRESAGGAAHGGAAAGATATRAAATATAAGSAVASTTAGANAAGAGDPTSALSIAALARGLQAAVGDQPICLMRLPLGWSGEMWHFRHPLDYLGGDGGGGVGAGPGMSIGAAIALKGSERLPIAILGDGDTMMGVSAFWTAANIGVPMLVIVCNNRSFFNDEIHQERVARERGRPIENRWIGQRIADPEPSIVMMARAQGLQAIGPVTKVDELAAAFNDGIARVKRGEAVVIDVHVTPGYTPSMAAGMTRSHEAPLPTAASTTRKD